MIKKTGAGYIVLATMLSYVVTMMVWFSMFCGGIYFVMWCLKHFGVI